jgi:hypothetical protein
MLRGVLAVCALVLCALPAAPRFSQSPPESSVRRIVRTRVIHIPLTTLGTEKGGPARPLPIDTLLVSAGGQDELPAGPSAFDVFDDDSFLIADPLRQRLAVFDAKGKFLRELKVGFAVDSVTITANGSIQVRQANTGDTYLLDSEGRPRPAAGVQRQVGEARLVNGQSATVQQLTPDGVHGKLLQIRFEKSGLRLVSVENLAADHNGNTYVALEATPGGEQIDVRKYVRKYSPDGKLISEISDIPLDYFISPVNELRVRKGILYQMMTTSSEIQINEWDTN